jgi:hypothetical protein
MEHYQVVILRSNAARSEGCLPAATVTYPQRRDRLLRVHNLFISRRSKAQAQYPCLTSCLPDVRPCKRKPPADIPSRLGAFCLRGAPRKA